MSMSMPCEEGESIGSSDESRTFAPRSLVSLKYVDIVELLLVSLVRAAKEHTRLQRRHKGKAMAFTAARAVSFGFHKAPLR